MHNIIQTERLNLRKFEDKDAEALFILNSDPEVMKYTGDEAFANIIEATNFIKEYDQYEKFNMGRWVMEIKSKKEFVGWCGLKTNKDGQIDIGFRLLKKYWMQGFGFEAAEACLNYGFNLLNLEEIIARTSINNKGAQNLIEKLGMERKAIFTYDNIGTSLLYVIKKENFQTKNNEKMS